MRTLLIAAATAAALFIAVASQPAPARADFKICNSSGENVSVAIAYHERDAGNWVSRGWWNIPDGECKTPLTGDLEDQYYYLYGDGDQHYWKGDHSFCVDNSDKFTLNEADTTCNYDYEGFFEIDTGDDTDYTYTFR